ncbi:Ribonuclease [Actinidia chinensis var. chinensis]|uniref:Ribonuclease n=1 Tax=Actinidia chinensis var. chinensis TaxID=1590841 RepID=A0A2R6QGC4_ACTCC|nr:Ribonuclease [Actinidia chinensis var. chinensis]
MRKFVLIIFFIVSCVCLQVESAPPPPSLSPPPPPPPAFPSYAIIQMVISWPPTYCQSGNPCKAWSQINKRFSLHGLWPADNTGTSVTDCRQGPTLSYTSQLNAWLNTKATLVTDLLNYWPSIRTDFQDDSFWKYQWNKHGVCSSSHICTNTYFEKAVAQSKKLVNLLDVLAASQIVPSPTKLYTAAEIKSAVQKIVGTTNNVYISCWRINNVINLREIFICLDQMAGNYVSCPASQDLRGCGNPKPQGTIKFPPFPTAEQGQSGPIEDLGFIDLAVDNIPMLL